MPTIESAVVASLVHVTLIVMSVALGYLVRVMTERRREPRCGRLYEIGITGPVYITDARSLTTTYIDPWGEQTEDES